MDIITRLSEELSIKQSQIEAAVRLIDDGNTIPFIARYRKEMTGSLDDEQLRALCKSDREFVPNMDEATRRHLMQRWHKAVEKSGGWEEG